MTLRSLPASGFLNALSRCCTVLWQGGHGSRRWSGLSVPISPLVTLLALSMLSTTAFAQADVRARFHLAPTRHATDLKPEPRGHSYAGWMALAYTATFSTAVLSLVVVDAAHTTRVPPVVTMAGVVAIIGASLLPAVVHALHGNPWGALRSELGMIGSILLGMLFGAVVSESAIERDDGYSGIPSVEGAVIGGTVGLLTWGLIDTLCFSRTTQE